MLLLLSPAKSLNFEPNSYTNHTQPQLLKSTQVLVERLQELQQTDLQQLMKISEKIAALNLARNHEFEFPFTLQNAKQAILAFDGDVYAGMNASDFSATELTFAQQHIGILSGLYGLLRPLDLMQPYRLEMGTKLSVQKHSNLYEYWGNQITDKINASGQEVIVNLASKEYFKSVKMNELKGKLYEVNFKEKKGEKYKIVAFYAKKARGMMCHYVVKNQFTKPEQMKGFDYEGYTFNEALSTPTSYIFTR